MSEPRFHAHSVDHIWRELRQLLPGISKDEVRASVADCSTTIEYVKRIHNQFLGDLKFWGIKEVEAAAHPTMIELLHPQHVVVLVRDIEDVALSPIEKINRQQWQDRYDWRWIEGYVHTSATALIDVVEKTEASIVLKYEDLLDPETLVDLARRVGARADGNPSLRLQETKRTWEIERNIGRAAAQISMRDRGLASQDVAKAEELCRRMNVYNEVFSYRR